MVHIREGYLSDSNIIKMCPEHQPIPMNRLDLLPTPMQDRSGMYSRPLKQPKIISRPETAHTMLQATQNLTGRDLTIDYKKAIAKEQKMPVYPEVLPQLTSGEVIPIYGSQSSTGTTLANLTYTALLQATQSVEQHLHQHLQQHHCSTYGSSSSSRAAYIYSRSSRAVYISAVYSESST
jgi:hypothetical protein